MGHPVSDRKTIYLLKIDVWWDTLYQIVKLSTYINICLVGHAVLDRKTIYLLKIYVCWDTLYQIVKLSTTYLKYMFGGTPCIRS